MDATILKKAAELNKFDIKNGVILVIKELHLYKPVLATFDSYIETIIKDGDGYCKTFVFPTERALENAIDDIKLNGNFNLKRLTQYVRKSRT